MSSVFYLLMNRIFATQSLYQENQGYQWLKINVRHQGNQEDQKTINRQGGRSCFDGRCVNKG